MEFYCQPMEWMVLLWVTLMRLIRGFLSGERVVGCGTYPAPVWMGPCRGPFASIKSIQLHDSIVMASPWDSTSYIGNSGGKPNLLKLIIRDCSHCSELASVSLHQAGLHGCDNWWWWLYKPTRAYLLETVSSEGAQRPPWPSFSSIKSTEVLWNLQMVQKHYRKSSGHLFVQNQG